MAAIAIICDSTSHQSPLATKTQLEALGHTVTLVTSAAAPTTDFSSYNVVAFVESNMAAASAVAIRDQGKPVFSDRGNILRVWSSTSFLGVQGPGFGDIDIVGSHPIHSGFSGQVSVMTGNIFNHFPTAAHTVVGTTIATRNFVGTLNARISQAVEAGTSDVLGNAIPARIYVASWVRVDGNAYEVDGRTILGQGINWLLGVGSPVISAVINNPTQFTVTVDTPGLNAVDHELYVSSSLTDLYNPANLHTGALGATPGPVAVAGRVPGLTYWAGVKAISGLSTAFSNAVSVTMPLVTTPTLVLSGVTPTSGTINLTNVDSADAAQVRYQTTLAPDTTYASPFDDVTLSGASRFVHQITGRSPSEALRTRVQWFDGFAWSAWIGLEWSTLAVLPPGDVLSHFIKPEYAELVTGTYCVRFAVDQPFSSFGLRISSDNGQSWSVLSGTPTAYQPADSQFSYWEVCFDSTLFADGFYLLELNVIDDPDGAVVQHHGFLIVNSSPDTVGDYAYGSSVSKYWDLTQPIWNISWAAPRAAASCQPGGFPSLGACSGSSIYTRGKGHIGGTIFSSLSGPGFGFVDPPWLLQNRGIDVLALFMSVVNGGGAFWELTDGGKSVSVGIVVAGDPADKDSGIRLVWESAANMSAIWEGDPGVAGGWLWSRVGRGVGRVVLKIGPFQFSKPVNAHVGWIGLSSGRIYGSTYCSSVRCGQSGDIPMRLRAWRPSPVLFPNRWSVYARVVAPSALSDRGSGFSIAGRHSPLIVEFNETVDLPTSLDCGLLAFFTARPFGDQHATNARVMHRWAAAPVDQANWSCGVAPPAPPTVDSDSESQTTEKAWAFELDGHVFYVLNSVLQPALLYDATVGQWYRWYREGGGFSEPEPFWNMFRGIVHKGKTIAADILAPKIWELDPHSILDEETLPLRRVVTGIQFLRGSQSSRLGSFRVTARKDDEAQESILRMQYSDDGGNTWSPMREVVLAAGSVSKRVEFRSLGRIRAPGRVWRIEDLNGFVRIEGTDVDMEGVE